MSKFELPLASSNRPLPADDLTQSFTDRLILDDTKIRWHLDRVRAWERGERIAPITIDMALTRACQASCQFCYSALQGQEDNQRITVDVMKAFLDDCAELGVRGISLVSDGESTLSKAYVPTIKMASALGISIASGTNAIRYTPETLAEILPHLTYLRVNFSAGTRDRWCEIMGCSPADYDKVVDNIRTMVRLKKEHGLAVTIGMQMVLRPQDADQILPFARLGRELSPDYAVIKHCSDDEFGALGVDYDGYEALYDTLAEAEALSTDDYKVIVKWSKIKAGRTRSYKRCYGPPFILQISGSGLIAPCGMLFNDRYKEDFHIGNIVTDRFKDIIAGDRYWQVVRRLASDAFDARTMCGTLCLQHKTNEFLDAYKNGDVLLTEPDGQPQHVNFI